MAIFVGTNNQLFINGVDLSDHLQKATSEDVRNQIDITAMGATNTTYTKGLGDGKLTVDLYQDFATSKVHQTLSPLISTSTPFNVEIRPVNGARSATNPAFLMTALLFSYTFLDNKVGDASMITAVFINAAQAGITYPTS